MRVATETFEFSNFIWLKPTNKDRNCTAPCLFWKTNVQSDWNHYLIHQRFGALKGDANNIDMFYYDEFWFKSIFHPLELIGLQEQWIIKSFNGEWYSLGQHQLMPSFSRDSQRYKVIWCNCEMIFDSSSLLKGELIFREGWGGRFCCYRGRNNLNCF
jgi:hypothetical protein